MLIEPNDPNCTHRGHLLERRSPDNSIECAKCEGRWASAIRDVFECKPLTPEVMVNASSLVSGDLHDAKRAARYTLTGLISNLSLGLDQESVNSFHVASTKWSGYAYDNIEVEMVRGDSRFKFKVLIKEKK